MWKGPRVNVRRRKGHHNRTAVSKHIAECSPPTSACVGITIRVIYLFCATFGDRELLSRAILSRDRMYLENVRGSGRHARFHSHVLYPQGAKRYEQSRKQHVRSLSRSLAAEAGKQRFKMARKLYKRQIIRSSPRSGKPPPTRTLLVTSTLYGDPF